MNEEAIIKAIVLNIWANIVKYLTYLAFNYLII